MPVPPLVSLLSGPSSLVTLPHRLADSVVRNNNQKTWLYLALFSACWYILAPSVPNWILHPFSPPTDGQMFKRNNRPDKYVVGLLNNANDCFANSNLQALSSLTSLDDYLSRMIDTHAKLSRLIKSIQNDNHNDNQNQNDITEGKENGKENDNHNHSAKFKEIPSLPLHLALMKIVDILQSTPTSARTISPWLFLNELEKIFNARISRSQHDAHELLQLILSTLDNEWVKFYKYLNHFSSKIEKLLLSQSTSTNEDDLITIISIPKFPFEGTSTSLITCLQCNHKSKPNPTSFLILSLMVPQQQKISLIDLFKIHQDEEFIEGYGCIKCRIKSILNIEDQLSSSSSSQKEKSIDELTNDEKLDLKNIKELREIYKSNKFNDISPELENYVNHYSKKNIKINKITSTISKLNKPINLPRFLTVHLSRSIFNGNYAVRNSCNIEFQEFLEFEVDDDDNDNDDDSDEKVIVELNEKQILELKNNEIEVHNGNEVQKDDSIISSIIEVDEVINVNEVNKNEKAEEKVTNDNKVEIINNNQSTSTPSFGTEAISQLLSKSKLNSTTTMKKKIKYKLKSIIRHRGTHSSGHYECFRHKPSYLINDDEQFIVVGSLKERLYVKNLLKNQDKELEKINQDKELEKINHDKELENNNDNDDQESIIDTDQENTTNGTINNDLKTNLIDRKLSISKTSHRSSISNSLSLKRNNSRIKGRPRHASNDIRMSLKTFDNLQSITNGNGNGNDSNLLHVAPAIDLQNDPIRTSISTNSNSSNQNNNEHLNDANGGSSDHDHDSQSINSSSNKSSDQSIIQQQQQLEIGSLSSNETNLNLKKLKKVNNNLNKYPYWRISDNTSWEVKKNEVLNQQSAVYMLFYERID